MSDKLRGNVLSRLPGAFQGLRYLSTESARRSLDVLQRLEAGRRDSLTLRARNLGHLSCLQ
jgi:hypothetical protein